MNKISNFKRKKRIHKFRTIHSSSNSEMKTIKKLKEDKTNIVLNNVIQATKIENFSDKENDNKEEANEESEEKENNLDFYIEKLIKHVPLEKRRKYLSESEIRFLSFKHALEIENRNITKLYISTIKEKNLIMSIFFNDKDFNMISVKLSLFIFQFNLSLAVNASFYNEEVINKKIFNDYSYNLSISFPALSIFIIYLIFKLLALTHHKIIKLRYYKKINKAESEVPKLIKKLKIKYVIYYILTISLNLFFFYYITVFGAIYSIVQKDMIINSLNSLLRLNALSIILSFIITIIRIFSLKKDNKFRRFLYFISKIL